MIEAGGRIHVEITRLKRAVDTIKHTVPVLVEQEHGNHT